MADYQERDLDDLTEEPSQHRLDELRSQGQVAQSRELTGAIVLLGVMATVYFASDRFLIEVSSLMKDIFSKDILVKSIETTGGKHDWGAFVDIGGRCGRILAMTFIPIGICSLLLGTLTSAAQIGGILFTTETLNPDLQRINPIAGVGRLFSMQSAVEGLKAILKFSVITAVVYFSIKAQLFSIPNVAGYDTQQLMVFIGKTSSKVFGIVGIFLLALAGLDYFIQWRRFRRQAMMTKAEAKQEMKEREGDPQIKARIRAIQRETARKRMMKAVPKADVIITNPTHIAIAVIYSPEEGVAPKVVAKGADFLAQKIKELAREHGIPTVENKPLARTLYKHVKVGQMIPRSLYQAVAEILAYVYKLKGRKLNDVNGPQL